MDEWQPNSWVQVTCPTQEDTRFLVDTFGVPDYYISDIADTDERARYDIDEGWILIILRIPYVKETKSRTPYTTIPLGIIMKGDVLITVCNFETNMMIDFVTYQQKRGLGFTDSVDMIFRLFLCSAVWYLKRLKQISTLIDELDADMIEDVNIEMSQARETTNIYANILDSTMDTYANIINNNMSGVMKMLTSISIILMFPTLIASLLGMNVINGMENVWWGFPLALAVSGGVTVLFMWYFKRKAWI